ncbi:MAG: PdaC/SigV domain-containing protein [Erythrobacter sp.]
MSEGKSGQFAGWAGQSAARVFAALLIAAGSAATSLAAEPEAPPPPATVRVPQKVAFTDNAAKGEAKRDFAYTWPAEVSAIPALVKRFTAEREKLLKDQKADWQSALKEFAGEDCGGCMMRDFQKTWEVVADLPRYLSLSASFYEYSGGAHGNGAYDALVWDRRAKAAIDPKAMFDAAGLQKALGPAWCAQLKTERQKRLGESYSDDGFFPCPAIKDLTVLVGSSDKRRFNRIGLLAAPYVAGSYAEGSYEVTLPVTPQVIAAVRPAYRTAFAAAK